MSPLFRKDTNLTLRTVVIAIFTFILIGLYLFSDTLGSLKKTALDATSSLYRLTDVTKDIGEVIDYKTMPRDELVQQNKALAAELLVHKKRLQLMASVKAENIRLRHLLNSSETIEDRIVIGELIGVSPDPSTHEVVVNRGARHGVYKGQALVDEAGLMGQVISVGENNSRVLLITDSSHALPVQINRNGVRLIAKGTGELHKMELRHVANTADIQEGDLLVSSGLGGRFPLGYPVAEVKKVTMDPSRPFLDIDVTPLAKMDRSRYVLLVFDKPPS